MLKTIITTVLLLFITASSCFAQDTECDHNATPCEEYAKADAVFIAKVTRIRPETIKNIWQRDKDYDQIANVVVEKVYKGFKGQRLVLHQLGRKNAPKFVLGSKYLFYANFDRATKKWEVRDCTRTRMAKYIHDDLRYLDGLPASAKKTRIAGEVSRYHSNEEIPAGTLQRLAGIKLRITGAGKEYEVTTDSNGVYELSGAAAGEYVIQPEIPRGLTLFAVLHYGPLDRSRLRSFKIELKEGACSGADIVLTTDQTKDLPRL